MTDTHKYRAFLSYSHKDLRWADWLHRSLERYRVPPRLHGSGGADHHLPRNLRPIFRDRSELSSGSSLPNVLNDALANSEFLIVICSPAAVASHWVNDEIRSFQKLGRMDRILCLIVDGEPLAGDLQECFPAALRFPVDAAGQPLDDPVEPIAADLRGGRHERHHAKMMLVAGLLGVGLDELLQRDHHRHTRNLFAIASAALVLTVAMAGLTVFALLAREEAEQRRADAENLVSFMLGDLREDLHAIQRLDLYNSVSRKAMDYFRSLGEEDAGDDTLALRAEALRQLGSSLLDQADMSGALEAFNESLDLSASLVAKNPSREDWNLALAESQFYVGYVHWQRGEFEAAGTKFLEQLSIVDALAAAAPTDLERLSGSGFAWTNYGRVLELGGQYEKARHAYETVMDIFQRLMVLNPEDENSRLEVGFAHNNLGKLKISLGLLDEAEHHFRSDLELKQQVVGENPKHNLWREHLAGSHYWLAKLLIMRGAFGQSQDHGESALSILEELTNIDPTMTPYTQRMASVNRLLATTCRLTGDSECAEIHIIAALSDLEKLTMANPDNAQWRRDKCASTLEAAWQTAIAGDMERAESLVEAAFGMAEPSASVANDDWETLKLRVLALLTRGDFANHASQTETAVSSWEAAAEILNNHLKGSSDPETIDLQAKLLVRQGRLDEAQRAAIELEQMGYTSVYPDWSVVH